MLTLPIDKYLDDISVAVLNHQVVVIESPPGSGKSTRVAPKLSESFAKIALLQPRRVAAKSVCERIADENTWKVGAEVGYRIRNESNISETSKIEVLTEGILSRILSRKGHLADYDCVVIDEYHERSIHIDLVAGWLKTQINAGEKTPRFVFMSATLDEKGLIELLPEAKTFKIETFPHPLETHYLKFPLNVFDARARVEKIVELTVSAFAKAEGSLLVFFPGVGEIDQFVGEIRRRLPDIECLPLHGRMRMADQKKVLQSRGEKRIIAATNVAETSLTVPDVRVVIDSGVEKQGGFEHRTGENYLYLKRISLASASQRAGRAARLGPGVVYKMWTLSDEKKMAEHSQPEVLRADLLDVLFDLISLGQNSVMKFPWIDAPQETAVAQALTTLQWMGLVTAEGEFTERAKKVQQFSVGVRLGTLLHSAREDGCYFHGRLISAFLESGARLPTVSDSFDCDVETLIEKLDPETPPFSQYFHSYPKGPDGEETANHIFRCIGRAFPDRVTRRRAKKPQLGKTVLGRGVKLGRDSKCRKSEFFVALDMKRFKEVQSRESEVSVASRLQKKWIEQDYSAHLRVEDELDEAEKNLQQVTYLGELELARGKTVPLSTEKKGEVFVRQTLNDWSGFLKEHQEVSDFIDRCHFAAEVRTEFSPFQKEDFAFVLELIWDETPDRRQIAKADLEKFFLMALSTEQALLLESLFPKSISVGSRRNLRVIYDKVRGAFFQAPLIDMYGVNPHPMINGGETPLGIELLAPNRRPIQFTTDIVGFWQTSYPAIRKELKGRYPKHKWPE